MFVKISIFTKKSVFSTVSGQKLAANLCPTASKSTRITPRHPWKLAPLVCFQTLVGWLRQTIDLRFSAKAPTMCLSSQGEQISNINIFISIHTANSVLHKLKHQFWVFSQNLKVSGRPQKTYHSQKAHQRRQLLRMPRGDSGGLGCC